MAESLECFVCEAFEESFVQQKRILRPFLCLLDKSPVCYGGRKVVISLRGEGEKNGRRKAYQDLFRYGAH